MTPDELREVSRRFVEEVFDRRNLRHAEDSFSANFIEHSPAAPDVRSDREGAIEGLGRLVASSEDLRIQILDHISDGRQVAIRGRCTGTDTGGLIPGIPATNKQFDFELIDVMVMGDEGRFVEHCGVLDSRTMMEQLGIVPSFRQPS